MRGAPDLRLGTPSLGSALLLMASIWVILTDGALASRWVGPDRAVFLSFGLAAAVALYACRGALRARVLRAHTLPLALGLAAGYAGLPAGAVFVAWMGPPLGLGFGASVPPGRGDPLHWISLVVFAPLFEELVYRGQLLPALRARVGPAVALLVTSLAFALPHLDPRSVLVASVAGLALGAVMLAGRCVGLCIGLHAGLNLASLSCGMPPERLSPPPLVGCALGAALLGLALWRARPPSHGGSLLASR